jgi:hypothetical protein
MWRYAAVVAVTILLAGAPGIVYALHTWGLGSDVEQIRDRQDDVRTRLTALEVQVRANQDLLRDVQMQLDVHTNGGN